MIPHLRFQTCLPTICMQFHMIVHGFGVSGGAGVYRLGEVDASIHPCTHHAGWVKTSQNHAHASNPLPMLCKYTRWSHWFMIGP